MNINLSLRKGLLCAAVLGSALLSTFASATDYTTAIGGRVFCDVNCDRKINEGVDIQLMKVKVQLLDHNGNVLQTTTPEVNGGIYLFGDLTVGRSYYVRVVPAIGQESINSFPNVGLATASRISRTVIRIIVSQANATYYPNDFLLGCCTKTWNQCEWGYSGCGFNPIDLLECIFDELYPNGVVVGGSRTLTFTSRSAILRFLPASGSPRKLTMTRVNPYYNQESELAGNILALVLNLKMSDEGITGEGLGERLIGRGPFRDMTVREFTAFANRVVGGETSLLNSYGCMSIYTFNCWVEWVNNNDWCCDCDDDCGGCGGGGYGGGGGCW